MKITVDFEKNFEECKSLLRSINIPIATDDKITVSFDLKGGAHAEAYCRFKNGGREILLKKAYITAKNPDIKHLKNLIMHELVHTCHGCEYGRTASKHSPLFREYAKKISNEIDYNILEFENLASYKNGDKPIKIKAYCKYCGCSQLFRNDKDIEGDYRAPLAYKYKDVVGPCYYCDNIMQYKLLS